MKKMNSLPSKVSTAKKPTGKGMPKIEFGTLGSLEMSQIQTKEVKFGNSR